MIQTWFKVTLNSLLMLVILIFGISRFWLEFDGVIFFLIGVRFFGCRFWGLKDIAPEYPWPSDGQPRIGLGPNPRLPRTAPDRGDTLDRVKLRLHSNQFIFTSCFNSSNWSSLTVEIFFTFLRLGSKLSFSTRTKSLQIFPRHSKIFENFRFWI